MLHICSCSRRRRRSWTCQEEGAGHELKDLHTAGYRHTHMKTGDIDGVCSGPTSLCPHLVVVAAVQPSGTVGIVLILQHVGKEAFKKAWAPHHTYVRDGQFGGPASAVLRCQAGPQPGLLRPVGVIELAKLSLCGSQAERQAAR